jgi:hypothetical protein
MLWNSLSPLTLTLVKLALLCSVWLSQELHCSVAWRKVYADIPDGADLDWDCFHLTVTQWVDKFRSTCIVDAYYESEAYEAETTYDLDQLFGENERVVTSKTLSDIPFDKQLVPITVLTIVSIDNTFFSQPASGCLD